MQLQLMLIAAAAYLTVCPVVPRAATTGPIHANALV